MWGLYSMNNGIHIPEHYYIDISADVKTMALIHCKVKYMANKVDISL